MATNRGLWLAVAFAAVAPLDAQWLVYPTAGVPRNADGSANLAAPAPRTPDGKPDFSGIWVSATLLPEGCGGPCIEQMPLPADAVDIGRTVDGGLPLQPWAAALSAERTKADSKDDPHARCLPPNFPRAYSFPQYKRVVQTKDLLVFLHEFNASFRQVHLDGRPLPTDPEPTWNGYSTAHWERDTLVIESIGYRDELWLDLLGHPLTSRARITERMTRPSYGTLAIELTVDDPGAYTRPWTAKLEQSIVLDTDIMDQVCLENEKSVRHMDP
ncbi:MAG TPA: hypothetical protein VM692_06540 [Gammaproteobacteria bacterium]|nr:hypothetical protein [Gammaproteobacteria bacterium]